MSAALTRIQLDALRVYLVASFGGRSEQNVIDAVSATLVAGLRVVQYRDKDEPDPAVRLRRAAHLRQLTTAHKALLIVNDDPELALEVGADGVHVGPQDMSVTSLKRRYPSLLIGASTGDLAIAVSLAEAGADYLGVGAIFNAQATKPDASKPRGPQILRRIVSAVACPVVGIGGINTDNAAQVFRAGAAGVAVVRAVLDATDPARVYCELASH